MIYTLARLRMLKRLASTAVFILGSSAAVLIAPDAGAQTVHAALPSLRPGQSVETVGPTAAIASTAHYQASLVLTCSGAVCGADFPKPGRNRLITVTRISCAFIGASNSTIGLEHADVVDAKGTIKVGAYLPIDYTTPQGWNILNQAIDLQAVGSQHLRVTMFFSTGDASEGACTATGTLSTLG